MARAGSLFDNQLIPRVKLGQGSGWSDRLAQKTGAFGRDGNCGAPDHTLISQVAVRLSYGAPHGVSRVWHLRNRRASVGFFNRDDGGVLCEMILVYDLRHLF